MKLIELSHIYKSYSSKNKKEEVLNDINLSFPNVGMVFILGKSGCGKSTLLNIIGGLDKPSKGSIKFYPYNKKSKSKLTQISFIFQNYHLLEDETSLFNVMLALLIKGESYSKAKEKAKNLLISFGFDDGLINKKVSLLSGGEKERVAIARALIVEPKVILADEPTGALDNVNSFKTMEALKEASNERLVIVVTHNESLIDKYADRVIRISDGQIIEDKTIKNFEINIEERNKKTIKHDDWTSKIVSHNFKKRFFRNLISIISTSFCLVFTLLMIGFNSNYKSAISNVSKRHLDYGFSRISKEEKKEIENSSLSLIKTSRPEIEEMEQLIDAFPEFNYEASYDYFLNDHSVNFERENIDELTFSFVYDFNKKYLDKNLLIEGNFPRQNSNEILINKNGEKLLDNGNKIIGKNIDFRISYENIFEDVNFEKKSDTFLENLSLKIVGIVDELDFMSVPKFYISYLYLDKIISSSYLENFSDFKNERYSWKRLIEEANNNDKNSGYNYYLFLNNFSKIDSIENVKKFYEKDYGISNSALEIKDVMDSLTLAADLGSKAFFIIILSGTILIISIFSYTAYVDDKKKSAILTVLGAKNEDIISIYFVENMITIIISFLVALILSNLILNPVNSLIFNITGIKNMIDIPMKSFHGVKYLLPFIIFISISLIASLSSIFPILFSKKISLKKELNDI